MVLFQITQKRKSIIYECKWKVFLQFVFVFKLIFKIKINYLEKQNKKDGRQDQTPYK